MKTGRILSLALAAGALVMVWPAAAGAATHHGNVTCHGGTVHTGTYRSLQIAGPCTLPNAGRVTVRHGLVVTRTGLFNAATPAKLVVWGNVTVRHRGIAAIGCSPDVGCAELGSDVIHGSVHAFRAWGTIIHATTVGGNVMIRGGGGTMDCTRPSPIGAPFYSVVEDSTVGGNLVVRRLHSCWLGVIRNQVGGTVRLIGNRFGDPDAMEIVTNHISGNLACFNNNPAAQVGDSQGDQNVVLGQKRGECATL
ncbi:MAG TPA: hypothetical protein VFI18_06100 [Gaiellales bacterium]|nr:hypothetical protein [Gaiellales bacterium]